MLPASIDKNLSYPKKLTVEFAVLFDLASLIIAASLTRFARIWLPFGEPFAGNPNLPYLPILAVSLIASYLINRKQRRGLTQLLFLLLLVALIIILMFAFSPPPVSRLYLIYLAAITFICLIAARAISGSAMQNSGLTKFSRRTAAHIEQIGERLNAFAGIAKLDYLLAAGFGVAWGQFIISMGLTLTPDSTTYLNSALHLFYAGQLSQSPLWPPLYPILIAIFLPFTRFPADAAALASFFCLTLFLFVFVAILRKISQNILLNLLFITCLATLVNFIYIFESAWSEQLFALCVISNFWLLHKFFETKRPRYFAFAAAVASLAMVTRYLGISLGLAVLFASLFWVDWLTLRERIQKFAAPALLMFAPLGAWMARNYLVAHSLFGSNRIQQESSLVSSLSTIAALLVRDLRIPFLALSALVAGLLVGQRLLRRSGKQNLAVNLVILQLSAYVGFLVLSAFISVVDIDTRFMSPIYFLPFGFLAAGYVLLEPQGIKFISPSLRALLKVGIIVLLIFMIGEQYNSFENVINDRRTAASAAALHQTTEGFDLSPTELGLHQYFSDALQTQDRLLLFVFLDDKNHYASSFLFKGSIIRGPDFENYRFVKFNGLDYEIAFSSAGTEKTIAYFDTSKFAKGVLFPEELVSKAGNSGNSSFYILVNEKWFLEYDLDPSTIEIPEGVSLLSSTHIEPYWIFKAEITQ